MLLQSNGSKDVLCMQKAIVDAYNSHFSSEGGFQGRMTPEQAYDILQISISDLNSQLSVEGQCRFVNKQYRRLSWLFHLDKIMLQHVLGIASAIDKAKDVLFEVIAQQRAVSMARQHAAAIARQHVSLAMTRQKEVGTKALRKAVSIARRQQQSE